MADGSAKNIEDIIKGDIVLSFDHEAGDYKASHVLYTYKSESPKRSFTLHFNDGNSLSIVGEHDLFEQESSKYVTITEENANEFIDKHFYSVSLRKYVALTCVTFETAVTDYYEIYTANTLNMVANGMLNAPDDVDYLLNIYEFNRDLSINKEQLAKDVEMYGLCAFEGDCYFSKEEYNAWNTKYVNIAVGKGLTTMEALWNQHIDYLQLKNSNGAIECA